MIRTAGIYRVSAHIPWGGSSAGSRIARIQRYRGATALSLVRSEIPPTGGLIASPLSDEFDFDAGDVVRLLVWQNSGGALTVGGSTTNPEDRVHLSVTYVRAIPA